MATIYLMFVGIIVLLIGISSWDFTNGRFKFDKPQSNVQLITNKNRNDKIKI